LKRPRLIIEEKGPTVPGYIVTFSDMVTLLLTFFVMLLSLADVQDPELFNKGRDAFIRSIQCIGLGALFGREDVPEFGNYKSKYSIPEPEETLARRTIDARTENLRRVFLKLRGMMKVVPSPMISQKTNFSVTNVHFAPGSYELGEQEKLFLSEFCLTLQQNASIGVNELYILGLAPDVMDERQQWTLSANRAKVVADFMQYNLSKTPARIRPGFMVGQPRWSVYSWGAGQGGDWAGPDGPISDKSHIMIAVLRAND
jgi:outer membrane protein OmpA-like peptidoglycan-associated protein